MEAGFIAYLRLKEAYATAEGNHEHAALAGEAAQYFRREHVARMAPALAERLANSGVEYLMLAAQALAERSGSREEAPMEPADE